MKRFRDFAKKNGKLGVLGVSLIASLVIGYERFGARPANGLEWKEKTNMTTVTSIRNAHLVLSVPKHIRAGDNFEATVVLGNNEEFDLSVHSSHDLTSVDFEIKGKDGRHVSRTKLGDTVLMPKEDLVWSGPDSQVKRSDSLKWTADLSKLFEMKPGVYSVSASVKVMVLEGDQFSFHTIKSNAIDTIVK